MTCTTSCSCRALIGSPHRIRYLDEALAYIAGHDKVWFATGGEIYEACRACHLRYAPHLNNTTEGVKENEKDGGKDAPAAAPVPAPAGATA